MARQAPCSLACRVRSLLLTLFTFTLHNTPYSPWVRIHLQRACCCLAGFEFDLLFCFSRQDPIYRYATERQSVISDGQMQIRSQMAAEPRPSQTSLFTTVHTSRGFTPHPGSQLVDPSSYYCASTTPNNHDHFCLSACKWH